MTDKATKLRRQILGLYAWYVLETSSREQFSPGNSADSGGSRSLKITDMHTSARGSQIGQRPECGKERSKHFNPSFKSVVRRLLVSEATEGLISPEFGSPADVPEYSLSERKDLIRALYVQRFGRRRLLDDLPGQSASKDRECCAVENLPNINFVMNDVFGLRVYIGQTPLILDFAVSTLTKCIARAAGGVYRESDPLAQLI
jgi:hypothetical protein